MAVLPGSLALTTIADGALLVAADHRNNYTAIQTEANSLLTILGAGTAGDVFTGIGTTVQFAKPPGYEWDYRAFTSASISLATTAAAAANLAVSNAVTYDGAAVWVEFFSPLVTHSVAGTVVLVDLWDGATDLGVMGQMAAPTGGQYMRVAARVTLSAGSHTLSARGWGSGAGTITANAGTGGAGNTMAGYLRVTKA